jgi:hypothetical protein
MRRHVYNIITVCGKRGQASSLGRKELCVAPLLDCNDNGEAGERAMA